MNTVFGVVDCAGPLDRDLPQKMFDAVVLTVRSSFVSHSRPNVFLGCCVCDSSPVFHGEGAKGSLIVWDGRIDNRPELLDILNCDSISMMSDSELALRAYEKWGKDFPAHLVGDFAFAMWDPSTQTLFCGRDPFGIRPFYYIVKETKLFFSSQIWPLVAATGENRTIDLEYIADFLSTSLPSLSERTPLKGLLRLLPRHSLTFKNGVLQVSKYWDFCPRGYLNYRNDSEYIEHFLSLFEQAVACSLEAASTVYADLSGGFDSSSIVCVAQQILNKSKTGKLATVTQVFSESKLSDETRWSKLVAEQCGLLPHLIDVDQARPFSEFLESPRFWDEPSHQQVFLPIAKKYQQISGDEVASVLLVGIGAEAIIMDESFRPLHLADILHTGKLWALMKELRRWQPVGQMPLTNVFLSFCLKPLLQPCMAEYSPRIKNEPPPYVESDFAQKWEMRGRAQRGHMPRRFTLPAMQYQYERIGRLPPFCYRGFMEKSLDIRYPFLHKPLVEFALAVPWSSKLDPAETKPLLKRAMKGILPEELRKRKATATFGHGVYRALRRDWPQVEPLLTSPALCEMGCIDYRRFQQAVEQARVGYAPDLPAVLSTLALEAWLKYHIVDRRVRNDSGEIPGLQRHLFDRSATNMEIQRCTYSLN
jgi:asparagine synthase (glutamine-hydrolysing)